MVTCATGLGSSWYRISASRGAAAASGRRRQATRPRLLVRPFVVLRMAGGSRIAPGGLAKGSGTGLTASPVFIPSRTSRQGSLARRSG